MELFQKRALLSTLFIAFLTAICSGCGMQKGYRSIDMDEAVRIMDSDEDHMIVDVRTKAEYQNEHIPGAILVPIEDIRDGKVDALPDKDQELLLYCRTGRRAEDAAALLVDIGYTNVAEFGGILEWKGDTRTGMEP